MATGSPIVSESLFPPQDEVGRLLCKRCGLPFKVGSVNELVRKALDSRRETELPVGYGVNCTRCKVISLFTGEELVLGRYAPVAAGQQPPPERPTPEDVRSDTGHLRCQACRQPMPGFSVKGSLVLLEQAGQPWLWVKCEACLAVSTLHVDALRAALPEQLPAALNQGDRLLGWPILHVMDGGMSIVYVCRDEQGRLLAAKMLRPKDARDAQKEARFKREAEAWVMLDRHPNLVEALQVTTYMGRIVVVMEYHENGSLANWISQGRVTYQQALIFARHFCLGMIHIAKRIPGFVHRDIKPANCLIGRDGMLKLADFGLARAFEQRALAPEATASPEVLEAFVTEGRPEHIYQTGDGPVVLGTLPYMSPEQFERPRAVDVRSDIYAFGATLFEMLTGAPLVQVASHRHYDWYNAHLQTPIPTIAGVPDGMNELLRDCLAKDPALRPADFRAVLQRLDALRASAPGANAAEPWGAGLNQHAPQLDLDRCTNLAMVGRLREALEYAEYTLRVTASLPDPELRRIGQAYGYASQAMVLRCMGRTQEAARAADQALRLNPDDTQALFERGFCANVAGDQRTALQLLNRCYQLDPNRQGLAFELGFALNAAGHFDHAARLLREALRDAPEDYLIYKELGFSLLHQRQFAEAIACFQSALAFCPPGEPDSKAELMGNLGQALLHNREPKLAADWLNLAHQTAPPGSAVRAQLEAFFKSLRGSS